MGCDDRTYVDDDDDDDDDVVVVAVTMIATPMGTSNWRCRRDALARLVAHLLRPYTSPPTVSIGLR